ncbi:hypothetical protein SM124_10000 [Bacillus sp. 31A1R]|uniref:Uncharacterized protein n=1 Tax=Robertmurraya mangrovi TaxID=3098077 RepID=A0ABU5IY28_9BACI|nr:hypothetical protein [Bacillus sp. 31A1R]MDZ5472079.1 hypothetical protein [Bacillus sp. 31A1R]
MKIKVIASMSIFLLLFSVAWLFNSKEEREFYVPTAEDEVVEIMPATYEIKGSQKKRYKAFKSREYVRIEAL